MPTPPRLLPALITPFTRRGELDLDAHTHNLATLWERGLRGFLIGGSTGEGPYLEPGERRTLTAAARETLGRRGFLMTGVAAETTRGALTQAEEAADGGADAILVLTPTTLARGRTGVIVGFFREVADRAPLPVYLYSVPTVTAYALPAEAIDELRSHPNVAGMKDSGGDPVRIQETVSARDDGFLVFNGASASLSLAMGAGAHGAITASANYAVPLLAQLTRRPGGSPARANPLQRRLTELTRVVESHGVAGTKAAAGVMGLRPGAPRRPLRPVGRAAVRRIEEALGVAGLLQGR